MEGEGSHGRSAVGEEYYSDSKDTACARLSLAPPKPAASLCPVMGAELPLMTAELEVVFKMVTLCGTSRNC